MRLLVLTAFYPPHHAGGYELRCHDVVTRLAARGHEILVLTTRCPSKTCTLHPRERGVLRVLRERRRGSFIPAQIVRDRSDLAVTRKVVKTFQPEIIYLWHVQNLSNALFPFFAGLRIPIVLDDGGTTASYLHTITRRGAYFGISPTDPLWKRVAKKLVYAAARAYSRGQIQTHWSWPEHMRVYFNGQSGKALALSTGAPVETASVIPSGVDLNAYPFQPREALAFPVRIIVPARFHPQKGLTDAVDLVNTLAADGIVTQLEILGEVQSQPYYQRVQAAIHAARLEERVRITPMLSQEELAERYRSADVCFFPTYFSSGRSRVPLEAMASGCVVITYGNEGSREVVENGRTGFLIPEADTGAAAQMIKRLTENPSLYQAITRNARAAVEERYNMDSYVSIIENFLEQSLPNKRSAG